MKKKLIHLFLLVSIICFYSCQKNGLPNSNNFRTWLNPDVKLDDVFSLSLNLEVRFDDQFKMYYTEDNSYDFNEKKTIRVKVKGLNYIQKITFNFPKNTRPTNVRIDLGVNKDQKVFTLDTISLGLNSDRIKIPPSSLLEYFEINNQLRYDSFNHNLKVIHINSQKYYAPIIKSKGKLFLEIKN
jgi:hypothetical protein